MPDALKPAVLSPDETAERFTDEGLHILEVSNGPDDAHLSVARARVAPGATTRWHVLDGIDERYVIISGTGLMYIGGAPPTGVGAGDVALIPSNTPQRIANTGRGDLVFYCVCTPRFVPASYRDVEQEMRTD